MVKKATGTTVPGGCHSTQEEAGKHIGALNHNVDDAKDKKDEGKKVTNHVKSYNSNDKSKAAAKHAVDYQWRGR